MRRSFVESRQIHTTSIRNKWHRRESGVRSVKEGTSTLLAPSGWDEHWQGEARACYCYVRHIQDLLADGKTLHERSCDTPFRGPIRPFGSVIFYHPISTKDKNRLHQFSSKVFNGIFIGHALNVGSGWTGDLLVADAEGSRDNTATGSTSKRIKEKEEVGIHKILEQSTFPSVNGSLTSAADGPNRHTTNPSRCFSNLVEVISESRRRR